MTLREFLAALPEGVSYSMERTGPDCWVFSHDDGFTRSVICFDIEGKEIEECGYRIRST